MDYFKRIAKNRVGDKHYVEVQRRKKSPKYKGEVTDEDYETFITTTDPCDSFMEAYLASILIIKELKYGYT